ncbi:unnamed protein product [Rhizoctonia solani]|uniref:pectin lyase n=1 Tax=Rhizoctonia solani TaxID=456999 RepID=A0A8H3D9J8_9AGAM|nr:unnamed protein product [Rhizoctonia solani]
MINLKTLAFVLFAVTNVLAVGSPFGFASGTTGGAAAAQAIPLSAAELKSWLEDEVTRNILLDRTYDFTDTEARFNPPWHAQFTGPGCKPWSCTPNPQLSLDGGGWCGSNPPITATYKKAGTSGIRVKSNKTILGKGTSGWIKGKGLLLSGVSNVIIQNIRISDLNPQYVWGGDALYIDNSSRVWVDHNYFKSVGRQFIVTGFGAAKQVTISNNYFDGQSTWSTGCDVFRQNTTTGPCCLPVMVTKSLSLEITSTTPPAVDLTQEAHQATLVSPMTIHIYNNYFNNITGHAIDADTGSKLLVEGNYFNNVKTPSTGNTNGAVFAPTSSPMNSQCSTTLGRNCVSNTLAGSGSLTNTANSGAISAFTASVVKSASVMDPGAVSSYVLANAGLGKVN